MMRCANPPGNRDLVFSLVRRCGGAALALTALSSTALAQTPRHSTDLGSAIDFHNDYSKSGPTITNTLVLRGDYAPEPWIALRLELPLAYVDTPSARPAMGFGDIYTRATARIVASDLSLLAGTDLVIDSAASPTLGGGKNVVGPFATLAWDIAPGAWLRTQVQHNASIGGDPHRRRVRTTSVRPTALVALPDGYWFLVDQKFQVYHDGRKNLSYSAVLEGGMELSPDVSVYIDPGVQIDSPWALTWMLTGGVRWGLPR
jgi:hypothetical protein